jgi:hypothetical protein
MGASERDYGVSDYHWAGRFTGSFNYQLPEPWKTGAAYYILGGWQLNGILTFQTGGPLNITTGFDNSFSGSARIAWTSSAIPNSGDRSRGEQILQWFNKAAFKENTPGTFGRLPNTERGPGAGHGGFVLFKNFDALRERAISEFRAEFSTRSTG